MLDRKEINLPCYPTSVDLIWRKHPPHQKLEVHHNPPLKSFTLTKQTAIDLMVFLIKILAKLFYEEIHPNTSTTLG